MDVIRSRVVAALVGAAGAATVLGLLSRSRPAGALSRTNYRGRPVSLAGGAALALVAPVAAAVGAASAAGMGRPSPAGVGGPGRVPATGSGTAAAALCAGLAAGAVGWYDDQAGARPGQAVKGFRGHLGALRSGRVTTGTVKIAGMGLAGLAAAVLLPRRRTGPVALVEVLLGAGVVAGTANLLNLLDLRPGRAAKAGLAIGLPLLAGPGGGVAAGTAGTVAALLPADVGERVMLGDTGANALGALLGVALAARTGPAGRAVLLAGLAALTAASERVSFTAVIEKTPWLRRIDEFGRPTR